MSARFLTHLGFLLSALVLTYLWTNSPQLSFYTLQATAFLVLLYFLSHLKREEQRFLPAVDGFIFTLVTLLLVSQTGGLTSPLFFLLYILLFGLALFFEPAITLIFASGLVVYFYPQIANLYSLVQIIGFLLMTPLALFFGKQYLRVLEEEEKIKILEKKKIELTQEVSQQEENTLLWLSLTFREHITTILDNSSNLLADLSHLTINQKERLQKIHESAKRLLKLGEKLKEKIEG